MDWYEQEVERVVDERDRLDYLPETIFYGSSSFTNWKTLYTDFAEYKPVNLGFGGSTLAACCWFFERIVKPVSSAKTVVIYAGDNDLGDGRNPVEVFLFYRELMALFDQHFGNVPIYYVSIKPSVQRWNIVGLIRETNALIQAEIEKNPRQHFIDINASMLLPDGSPDASLYESDGLHLSAKGYDLWKNAIKESLESSL